MIKLLLGGSPCTFWSIAQKNNRETEAEGVGWELFKNYLIAKKKFKPDFFLYENNKSAAQPIKDQISRELGVDLMYINSALVSAQNRQRFYAFNWEVEQPEDRGILLRDILESGVVDREKTYALVASHQGNARDYFKKQHAQIALEPVSSTVLNINPSGKGINGAVGRVDAKSRCLTTNKGEGQKVIIPVEEVFGVGYRNRREEDGKLYRRFETHGEEKANALTTVQTDSMVAEPVRIGDIGSTAQAHRVYSCDGKSVTINAGGGGQGGKTGLYACPVDNVGECETIQKAIPKLADKFGYVPEKFNAYNIAEIDEKSPTLPTGSMVTSSCATTIFEKSDKPVYEVKDGLITIKGKQYPIKLADGYYIIRKLTPVECERLQTLPDGYTKAVSNAQRYKGLGNGWTAEVIIHILNGVLKDIPRDEEIVVLSMYDGIGTGRYCLDKMGFTNVRYYAYEIDKYAKQVSMSNYPDIIQMGDAFDLRHPDWTIGY